MTPKPDTVCQRCGNIAEGFAFIGNKRYCHGDSTPVTCYMLASADPATWEDLDPPPPTPKRLML